MQNRNIKAFIAIAIMTPTLISSAIEGEYESPVYQAQTTTKWAQDAGLAIIKIGGQNVIRGNFIFADPPAGRIQEVPSKQFTKTRDKEGRMIIKMEKTLAGKKDQACYGKTLREYTFAENEITAKITIEITKDINFQWLYQGFKEMLNLNAATVGNATVEGIRTKDNEKVIGQVVVPFDKQNWKMGKDSYKSCKFITDTFILEISGAPQTTISLAHYGGKNIEVRIMPILKLYQRNLKAGDTISWNYIIKIENIAN